MFYFMHSNFIMQVIAVSGVFSWVSCISTVLPLSNNIDDITPSPALRRAFALDQGKFWNWPYVFGVLCHCLGINSYLDQNIVLSDSLSYK
jgi:hypothetical protein